MHRVRRSRRLRLAAGLVVLVALGLVAAELGLRFGLGLGTPLLYDLDPAIEYLPRPNQQIRRFGNRVVVNEWGMRSGHLPAAKTDPRELRVLVLGDSVVHGGVQTDQERLATTILEHRLAEETGRPVRVGNVGAGSWGPPNLLAYVDRFGFFDADVVILVLSSHDADDAPTKGPPNPTQYPTENPTWALEEFVFRYARAFLPAEAPPAAPAEDRSGTTEQSLRSLAALLERAKHHGARVVVLQHWGRGEVAANAPDSGHDLIAAVVDAAFVERFDVRSEYERFGTEACFRDLIHLSDRGQAALAQALLKAVLGRDRRSTD